MTDELAALEELERRLLAACYAPARRRARAWSWAGAGLVVGGVVVALALFVGSGSVTPSAASALERAAAAVASGPALTPLRPGQYWYTRTLVTARVSLFIFPKHGGPPTGSPLPFVTRESVETWIGVDGTLRQRTIVLSQRFLSPADHARWLASGQPLPTTTASDSITAGDGWFPPKAGADPDVGDGLFSYAQLLALPTNIRLLRMRIHQARAALDARILAAFAQSVRDAPSGVGVSALQLRAGPGYSLAGMDLQTIYQLLSTPVPTAVRAALFRLVAALPGVTYEGNARDPLGRSGVAVAVGIGAARVRLIFNPRSGALLANVGADGIANVVVTQGTVDSLRQLPAGVKPTPGPAGLAPVTIAISPRTGRPSTTFTLTTPAVRQASHARAPAVTILTLTGPSGSRCKASLPVPVAAARAPKRSGAAQATYRLTPADDRRSTWCSGRYQVQILHTGNNAALSPAGAVYFQVDR
jgi:hypothetical protein